MIDKNHKNISIIKQCQMLSVSRSHYYYAPKTMGDENLKLMHLMNIHVIYQKTKTSIPNLSHKIYPYLLRNLAIEKPNQVWAIDITYIPMQRGFLYVVAIIDWFSRKVLAWKISNSMEVDFCIVALSEAIDKYGKTEIFNSDQGSQFTSNEFTNFLLNAGIKISMDGKSRWMDNVFIERLWRRLK